MRETVGTYALYLRISPYISVYLRMIGTILERHTVGKYALGKGAPVRDCRALTPVRNQVSVRDRSRGSGRDRVRVRVRFSALTPVRNQVSPSRTLPLPLPLPLRLPPFLPLPLCLPLTRWLTAISRTF